MFCINVDKNQSNHDRIALKVDATAFATAYERNMLALENLTPDQVRLSRSHLVHGLLCSCSYDKICALDQIQVLKLEQCKGKSRVNIEAPAGAGKTFLALHEMLRILTGEDQCTVLFITRGEALCTHVAKWLFIRLRKTRSDEQIKALLMERFQVLFESSTESSTTKSFGGFPRSFALKEDKISFKERTSGTNKRRNSFVRKNWRTDDKHSFVVVDEAHHLYEMGVLEEIVKTYSSKPEDRLMLLSDVSQSYVEEMSTNLKAEVRRTAKLSAQFDNT